MDTVATTDTPVVNLHFLDYWRVIRLRKSGRGTLISIRHSGYPRTPGWVEIYGGTQAGWAYYLMNLKSVLETGRDLRSPKDA